MCVSFDYLLLEHPLNGFLIVWLIFHCQKRHSEEMPITGTDDLAGYFIFYFIFHFILFFILYFILCTIGQHLHGIRHHHSFGRFWFDLSEVPAQTTVISAELRLYINLTMVQENMNCTEKVDEEKTSNQNFSVTVYEIGLEDMLIYIDSMEIYSQQEGWVAVNVSVPLQKWIMRPEENFGLQLVCRLSTSGS